MECVARSHKQPVTVGGQRFDGHVLRTVSAIHYLLFPQKPQRTTLPGARGGTGYGSPSTADSAWTGMGAPANGTHRMLLPNGYSERNPATLRDLTVVSSICDM
jgi:hypothetical protein